MPAHSPCLSHGSDRHSRADTDASESTSSSRKSHSGILFREAAHQADDSRVSRLNRIAVGDPLRPADHDGPLQLPVRIAETEQRFDDAEDSQHAFFLLLDDRLSAPALSTVVFSHVRREPQQLVERPFAELLLDVCGGERGNPQTLRVVVGLPNPLELRPIVVPTEGLRLTRDTSPACSAGHAPDSTPGIATARWPSPFPAPPRALAGPPPRAPTLSLRPGATAGTRNPLSAPGLCRACPTGGRLPSECFGWRADSSPTWRIRNTGPAGDGISAPHRPNREGSARMSIPFFFISPIAVCSDPSIRAGCSQNRSASSFRCSGNARTASDSDLLAKMLWTI